MGSGTKWPEFESQLDCLMSVFTVLVSVLLMYHIPKKKKNVHLRKMLLWHIALDISAHDPLL